MNVREYIDATGVSLHELSQRSGVSYPTLHAHARHGAALGLKAAKKLEAFDARLNAAEILGLRPASPSRGRGKAA